MLNPYAAPITEFAKEIDALAGVRRKVLWAFAWLVVSVLVFGGAIALANVTEMSKPTILFAGAALVALAASWQAFAAVRAALRARGAGFWLVGGGLLAALLNAGMVGIGLLCTWLSTVEFTRGRQLRSLGRVLLPPLSEGGGLGATWANAGDALPVEDTDRAAVAAQWRQNGRTEHASVAAFARLTLDLMALGAPPALIAAAQRDALDEIAHTEACFALARAIDGRAMSPAAFPRAARARTLPRSRRLALAILAVDSLVDGALHEGVSARIVAKLARRCEDPTIRAALRKIAADEGRHAAHGWDVVRWCLEQGGAPVASALAGALLSLPKTMRTPLPAPAAAGAWEKWGLHGHALESEEYGRTHADLVARVTRACNETATATATATATRQPRAN